MMFAYGSSSELPSAAVFVQTSDHPLAESHCVDNLLFAQNCVIKNNSAIHWSSHTGINKRSPTAVYLHVTRTVFSCRIEFTVMKTSHCSDV